MDEPVTHNKVLSLRELALNKYIDNLYNKPEDYQPLYNLHKGLSVNYIYEKLIERFNNTIISIFFDSKIEIFVKKHLLPFIKNIIADLKDGKIIIIVTLENNHKIDLNLNHNVTYSLINKYPNLFYHIQNKIEDNNSYVYQKSLENIGFNKI